MPVQFRFALVVASLLVVCPFLAPATSLAQTSDDGFVELFDGKSLKGWRARPHFDPRKEAAFTDEERGQKQDEWTKILEEHWTVDSENGEIVSDGHGVFLTTEKEYGDFEFHVDWKMLQPNGDSGIYVRGCPQIQIWDPNNKEAHKHGSDKGSGALWNNGKDHPGKWPLVLADKPVGEWNTFRIRMIGSRVWVWFNDQLTVDGAVMDNFFDRSSPMFASGVIQLQTHGSETRFRNLRVREIDAEEANKILDEHSGNGLQSIFNGRDFEGWSGPTNENKVEDGMILSNHGTIYHDRELVDFVTTFEFLLPPGGNNGLAIRYPGKGDTAYVGMCELQVLDSEHEKYEKLDERQFHGSAYGIAPAVRGYLRNAGEWNFQKVTVKGMQITVELNGTIILDADLSAVEKFMADSAHPGLKNEKGYFGFAGHGDAVKYRNIKAKSL